MKRIAFAAGIISLAVSGATLASPVRAATLYTQSSDGTVCDTTCWTSTDGAGGSITGGYQAFDNFSLSSASTVTSVSWYGGYIDSAGGSNPATPTTTSWQIGFYADDGGLPGAQLYSTSIAAGSVTVDFLGDDTAFNYTVPFYEFTATLPAGFSATSATTYWFSPLSEQPTFEPFFTWSPSNTGDGLSAQMDIPGSVNTDGDATYSVAGDRAFALYGTSAAPEPAIWALMLAGFGGCGLMLRQAKRPKESRAAT